MRKIIFVVLAFICVNTTSFAQKNIPKKVLTGFHQQFPTAQKIKWDKENATEYEAAFDWNGARYAANFSNTGEWLETESPITFKELPVKIQESFTVMYKNAIIKGVAKIEKSTGNISYEIEMKRGKKTVEVFYDETGKEITM